MARVDRFGDKGHKKDRRVIASGGGGRLQIGAQGRLHRADGTTIDYVETVAGKRFLPSTDTRPSS